MDFGLTVKSLDSFKAGFFDTAAVERQATAKEKKVLSRLGAYIMRRARKSLKQGKRKKRQSEAGKPPVSHTRLLEKSVLFAWDPSTRSVVVGAYKFDSGPSRPTVPELLEHGGRSAETGKKYRAFPFIQPAGAAELPKLPALWASA